MGAKEKEDDTLSDRDKVEARVYRSAPSYHIHVCGLQNMQFPTLKLVNGTCPSGIPGMQRVTEVTLERLSGDPGTFE